MASNLCQKTSDIFTILGVRRNNILKNNISLIILWYYNITYFYHNCFINKIVISAVFFDFMWMHAFV